MTARLMSLLLTLPLLLQSGCTSTTQQPGTQQLQIVATTGMIADAASFIVGNHGSVKALMGPGVDPHLYKASSSDVASLSQADLILYNGLHLEGKMAELFEQMGQTRPTVAVGSAIPDSLLRHPTEFEGAADPHIWFDLTLWRMAVTEMAVAIGQVDSLRKDDYGARANQYLDSLDQLHHWVHEQIATIPADQRVLITAHDAFGYFGRQYGLEVHGLQGISTVSEAGLYDVTALVDLLVERKLKAVFVESSVPRKAIDAVVAGVTSRGHTITIGGELFSDAMGTAGTAEGTFFGMVRHNVITLTQALR